MNLSEVTQEIGNDPQSLGTRPATACQAPRWPRRHSIFLQKAAWALPGRCCAPSLPESHLETSVVPLFGDTPCKAWPLVVSPLGWAGLRWRGWGWGPGRREGDPGLEESRVSERSSCFNSKASLSRRAGRPASPPAPGEESVRAPSGKLPETRSKNGYSGFTGKEKRKGRDLMPPKAGSSFKENLLLQWLRAWGPAELLGGGRVAFSRASFSHNGENMGTAFHKSFPPSSHGYVLSTYSARLRGWILPPPPSRKKGRCGPCCGDVLAARRTDNGAPCLVWGSGKPSWKK